jgi:L-ribulose-5-phosphate 3-epimerase
MTRGRPSNLSRRGLLQHAAVLLGGAAFRGVLPANAAPLQTRFQIGACDWSIGQRGKVEALTVARLLGLDGVQVSMGHVAKGPAETDLQLRQPAVQRAYREAAATTGLRVGGIALDVMNQVPYKSDPRTEEWVSDSIDVARALDARVVLLAFFERGDLRNDADGQAEVIRRLRQVATKAESRGVILGIESWLSAADHLRILDAVGSANVQVYYDVANSTQMGYDIAAEIRQLGAKRICEFHAKENGFLLGQGRIAFAAVRKAIDDIGYAGWIQIEGAVPKGQPMLESYVENVRFMRTLFS